MISIIIADDHHVVREGLKQIISEGHNMQVTGEAKHGQELLDLMSKEKYDVVIMDLSMPGKSGLELLKELKSIHPKTPVLVLSMHPEEKYGVRVLRAGASGYMTKESAPAELIKAIDKIYHGGKYVSELMAEEILTQFDDMSDQPHKLLTDREYEVLLLLAKGISVKDISEKLLISPATVSTYRARILEKMNLSSNADITYYAIKAGLID